MPLHLPAPVVAYFALSNGSSANQLADCFTPDAIVRDEGRTHQGHPAIESWQREARSKFTYSVEPISAHQAAGRLVVTATVTGNFPGSPVQLDHAFQLMNGKIQSLEIG